MCHIFRLIVCSVEVVDTTYKASIHDGKILIGECHIDDKLGFVAVEKLYELRNAVGINNV